MLSIKNANGDICNSIKAPGWTDEDIANRIREIVEREKVEAEIKTDSISTGIFGSNYPCVVVHNSDLNKAYYDHWIILNGDVISFKFGGYSSAAAAIDRKQGLRNSGKITGMLISTVLSDATMEWEVEQVWHNQMLEVYGEVWYGNTYINPEKAVAPMSSGVNVSGSETIDVSNDDGSNRAENNSAEKFGFVRPK